MIREDLDLQQPENALATLLSLIRSARTTERLVTAPRGDTYFNGRPRGRRGEYLARREAKLANERGRESSPETGKRCPRQRKRRSGPTDRMADTLTFLPGRRVE